MSDKLPELHELTPTPFTDLMKMRVEAERILAVARIEEEMHKLLYGEDRSKWPKK